MRTDPRIRQSLNQISDNLESASESVCVGCFSFSKTYLEPLFNSIADGCTRCCSCIPEEAHHHLGGGQGRNAGRGRNRGRSEFPFDFYNDDNWYDDYYGPGGESADGFLGSWGNDELDRLLAGNAPRRGEEMYYGIGGGASHHGSGVAGPTNGALGLFAGRRRRQTVPPHDVGHDPTVIPNTSMFGFLSRWPLWRSTLRYRPSAADLQEHPGMPRDAPSYTESEPEVSARDINGGSGRIGSTRGRKRSGTASSGESGSFRSRGDLFPSEDEDDAVPLGDEFSIALRGPGSDGEISARRMKKDSIFSSSPASTGIMSNRNSVYADARPVDGVTNEAIVGLGEEELRKEEQEVVDQEERELERKRLAAQRLALQRGLSIESGSSPKLAQNRSSSSSPAPPPLERTLSLPAPYSPRMPLRPSSLPRSPIFPIHVHSSSPNSPQIVSPIPMSARLHDNLLRQELIPSPPLASQSPTPDVEASASSKLDKFANSTTKLNLTNVTATAEVFTNLKGKEVEDIVKGTKTGSE